MNDAFQEVLNNLRVKIREREIELHHLNTAVKVLIDNAPKGDSRSDVMPIVTPAYIGLSLRKAILKLLSEEHNMPNTETAEIAKALIGHGMTTNGKSFVSNVSATLSDMSKVRGEVEYHENNGWELTYKGCESAGIKVADSSSNGSQDAA